MRSVYEKKVHSILAKEGGVVDYKARPFRTPKGYNVDYFGLFDLMSLQDGVLRCVAVKGHQGIPKALRNGIEAFKVKKIVKEIWSFAKSGIARVEEIE